MVCVHATTSEPVPGTIHVGAAAVIGVPSEPGEAAAAAHTLGLVGGSGPGGLTRSSSCQHCLPTRGEERAHYGAIDTRRRGRDQCAARKGRQAAGVHASPCRLVMGRG